jgi:hypothetical protein
MMKLEGKGHLEDTGIDGKVTLKWMLVEQEWGSVGWFVWLAITIVTTSTLL